MSEIDGVLERNGEYARGFQGEGLSATPEKALAIVTCMDTRISPYEIAGLKNGEVHVIRNAGGIVNEETVRSLLVSTRMLGVREVMIVSHTDCGMLTFTGDEFRERLRRELQLPVDSFPMYSFTDVDEIVRLKMRIVREHPYLSRD